MKIRGKEIDDGLHLWGILNVTPDSFSDGGKYDQIDAALFHAEEMAEAGADIIDIGGMSTRPGHEVISIQEEIDRLCPVVEAVRDRLGVFVSADTYRAEAAEAAAKAGADIINDIWGLKADGRMAEVIARYGLSCCLMHNSNGIYVNFFEEYLQQMKESIALAKRAGIERDRIIIDPGIGFGKDTPQNLICIKEIDELSLLGYPVLLAASRKSVIGNTLNLPKEEREEGTIAITLYGLSKGIRHFRVHDVEKNMRAAKMWLAIDNVK